MSNSLASGGKAPDLHQYEICESVSASAYTVVMASGGGRFDKTRRWVGKIFLLYNLEDVFWPFVFLWGDGEDLMFELQPATVHSVLLATRKPI